MGHTREVHLQSISEAHDCRGLRCLIRSDSRSPVGAYGSVRILGRFRAYPIEMRLISYQDVRVRRSVDCVWVSLETISFRRAKRPNQYAPDSTRTERLTIPCNIRQPTALISSSESTAGEYNYLWFNFASTVSISRDRTEGRNSRRVGDITQED